jgi:hypothetical protein
VVQRWATGWMIGGSSPARGWGFFCSPLRLDHSGARPASYPIGTTGSFPGSEADHLTPSSAEVKECVDLYLHSPNTPS